ncbi:MAG TPA: CDP-alcohol phosphatidyltransferase family protein [Chloroflexia bacterium]|nr:CDP-alcohol phosphatidyltransferase family protein [Chloroflexia bacterium]
MTRLTATVPLPLKVAGLAVHFYTAVTAVLAFGSVLAAMDRDVTLALWLNALAVFIDATDGVLARRLQVRQTLPWFDGALLDNIVDYLTYVFVPVVLLWTGDYLPHGPVGLVLATVPLLASGYQFCRVDAKTNDHFFLGFPSYWNVVAFYAIVGAVDVNVLGAVLLLCAVGVFVPIRYVYPTRTRAFMPLTLGLAAIWGLACAVLLWQMPRPAPWLVSASYLYVVYYGVLSLYLTATRRAPRLAPASD